ncbi:MAG TPA: hypothetical protein VKB86_13630 [Pyrinomonadaceae bacterium]|nr:hypothetical protein [Pyrinomonadaceae bacterium]
MVHRSSSKYPPAIVVRLIPFTRKRSPIPLGATSRFLLHGILNEERV